MKLFKSIVGLVFACFVSTTALAQSRAVVADVQTLQGLPASPGPYISITCYHQVSSNVICAGGGDFDRVSYGTSPCTSSGDQDNGATILKDGVMSPGKNCYYRKNWGLNGVIDARQCGVYGDGIHDDTDALNSCLLFALAASPNRPAIPIVSTGGGQVRIDGGSSSGGSNLLIPGGITLSCGGGNAVGVVQSNDYRTAQHAIWLWNDSVNTSKRFEITGTDTHASSAGIDGCLILRGNGTNSTSPYDYAPNKFLASSLREALIEVHAFTGTAIYANADSFSVRNTTILGFAQCWQSEGATRVIVDHVDCDGTAGFWVDSSGGGAQFDTTFIRPFLTGMGGCNNCTGYTWPGIVLRQNGSAYQVLMDTTPIGSYPADGDTVWVGTPIDHVQSAAGRYANISGVTLTTMDPACPSSSCVYFDLPGSVFSSSTNKRSATATFASGATALTGLSIDTSTLAVGMNIGLSGSCIPTTLNATITDIHPSWNTIWISAPTTCDSGTNNNVQIWDSDDTSPTHSGSLTLSATERSGDAYRITNSAGATFNNCKQDGHYVGFHAGENSNLTRFANCVNDNNSTLQDDGLIAFLCDGQHDGQDCSETQWTNGNLGQHAAVAIVLNSDSTHGLRISNSGLGPDDGRQNGRYADVEAGTLLLDNSAAGIGGNLFVSNGATFRVAYLDKNNLGSGYAVNNVVRENDGSGSCGTHAEITITAVDTGGKPTAWQQTTQGVCIGWPTNPWATTCVSCSGTGARGDTDGAVGARLAMSNVVVPNGTLYLQGPTAVASTAGCGNTFLSPIPFTCTPASIVPPPQGRLTLSPCDSFGCYPVMRTEVTGGGAVYYVPYIGQQVPIYSNATGTFSPVDIGTGGLQANLNSTNQVANTLYDLFVHLQAGVPELCVGPAWSSTSVRNYAITPINGIRVNVGNMSCWHASSMRQCAEFECTYVGTMYTTAAGQTSQQFGPISGAGGGAACLCLYNAYNRVTLTSASADTTANYIYNGSSWRLMDASANNSVSVVDGLGQMQISAQLSDVLNNGTTSPARTAAIGILFGSISAGTPTLVAQANSSTKGTYTTTANHPPIPGFWAAFAVESAITGSSGNASFGGPPYQQIAVQVED